MQVFRIRSRMRRQGLTALFKRLAAQHVLCSALFFKAAMCYFHYQEGWSWSDSFYFIIATLSTVGYGDVSPQTAGGKLVACALAVFGIGVIMQVLNNRVLEYENRASLFLESHSFMKCRSDGGKRQEAAQNRHIAAQVLLLLGITLVISVMGRQLLELECWLDCFYFAVITLTTVGYGDMAPLHCTHRLGMSLLILLGVPLFAQVLSNVVEACTPVEAEDDAQPVANTVTLRDVMTKLHGEQGQSMTVKREDYLAFSLVQKGLVHIEDVLEAWEEFRQADPAE